jgi:hypothetical protein
MGYKTGKAKSLDDITLEDIMKYPIWVWAWDEEGTEEMDETWQKPIIDTTDVTENIFTPIITIRVKNTIYYGSGEYNKDTDQLKSLSIWKDDQWIDVREFTAVPTPLNFVAVPTIKGESNVEFICNDISTDLATRK